VEGNYLLASKYACCNQKRISGQKKSYKQPGFNKKYAANDRTKSDWANPMNEVS